MSVFHWTVEAVTRCCPGQLSVFFDLFGYVWQCLVFLSHKLINSFFFIMGGVRTVRGALKLFCEREREST